MVAHIACWDHSSTEGCIGWLMPHSLVWLVPIVSLFLDRGLTCMDCHAPPLGGMSDCYHHHSQILPPFFFISINVIKDVIVIFLRTCVNYNSSPQNGMRTLQQGLGINIIIMIIMIVLMMTSN